MDKLWSPWRSKYIESFREDKSGKECIFCAAIEDQVESDDSLVLYKGKYSYITLNLYPYNSGHLMIIPKRHLCEFTELSQDELAEMMMFAQKSMKALEIIMGPQGFNLGVNIGKAAGAGIHQHIHIHLLPRWIGDTNFMPAIGEVKIISQDLMETKKNFLETLKKVFDN